MQKQILKLSINLSKIDKALIQVDKNGNSWLNCTCFLNEDVDQYGGVGMAVQDISKADREAGKKGNILGNFKPLGQPKQEAKNDIPNDLPF